MSFLCLINVISFGFNQWWGSMAVLTTSGWYHSWSFFRVEQFLKVRHFLSQTVLRWSLSASSTTEMKGQETTSFTSCFLQTNRLYHQLNHQLLYYILVTKWIQHPIATNPLQSVVVCLAIRRSWNPSVESLLETVTSRTWPWSSCGITLQKFPGMRPQRLCFYLYTYLLYHIY